MAQVLNMLPQTNVEVDGEHYLIDAFPTTIGLEYLDKVMETGFKLDPKTIRSMITSSVSKDGKRINEKSFDILFARKTAHLTKLVGEVIKFNFEDVFTESGTEGQE